MSFLKKISKIILKFFIGFIILVLLYFLAAALLSFIPANRNFKSPKEGVPLFLLSNGLHLDLCFAKKDAQLDWVNVLGENKFITPDDQIKYYSFGWGDRAFFLETPTWDDLSYYTAAKSLLVPTQSAFHVSAKKYTPRLSPIRKKVIVSQDQLLLLEKYIIKHFKKKEEKAILIDCCRYNGVDDNFFEANGKYTAIRTCNTWANQALKYAGVKTATWGPLDKCILHHFK